MKRNRLLLLSVCLVIMMMFSGVNKADAGYFDYAAQNLNNAFYYGSLSNYYVGYALYTDDSSYGYYAYLYAYYTYLYSSDAYDDAYYAYYYDYSLDVNSWGYYAVDYAYDAYINAYYAYQYGYYSYLYGGSYIPTALYYVYLAQTSAADAMYYAAGSSVWGMN